MENISLETIESRSVTRDDCEIEAGIRIGTEHELIFCMIRNMSPKGAKIKLDGRKFLPRNFDLVIPISDQISETCRCELRWRVDDVVGVRFETSPPHSGD